MKASYLPHRKVTRNYIHRLILGHLLTYPSPLAQAEQRRLLRKMCVEWLPLPHESELPPVSPLLLCDRGEVGTLVSGFWQGFWGAGGTWEGYVLSQEGPRQCLQDAGFICTQCLSGTGLQLPVWMQSTLRDWKPLPQTAVQGFQGPTRQHASQGPEVQFLLKAGLKWKKKKKYKMGEDATFCWHQSSPFSYYEFHVPKASSENWFALSIAG